MKRPNLPWNKRCREASATGHGCTTGDERSPATGGAEGTSGGAVLLAVLLGTLATGCTKSDYADLEAFADRTAQKFRSEPTSDANSPPKSSGERFTYAAGELRSPFQPPPILTPVSDPGQPRVAPDFERPKRNLERFSLAQLRLVGRLSSQQAQVALVQDPNGLVHAVGIGEHMGTDFGRIRAVGEDGIELVEIVRDAGGWVERHRFITLTGEQGDE